MSSEHEVSETLFVQTGAAAAFVEAVSGPLELFLFFQMNGRNLTSLSLLSEEPFSSPPPQKKDSTGHDVQTASVLIEELIQGEFY